MCDTLEKQRIYLISNIIQGDHREQEVFECSGEFQIAMNERIIHFANDSIEGSLRVQEKQAVLTYKKPYANTLTFKLHQSTHANYSSIYGVMSLIIDTKKIELLEGKVVLKYELLQTKFKVGEYEVSLVYGEGNNK